jgi:hypothetical protein
VEGAGEVDSVISTEAPKARSGEIFYRQIGRQIVEKRSLHYALLRKASVETTRITPATS